MRERRERLFKRAEPRVRPFDIEKDAWIMWAAYDLNSFPALPKGLKQNEFFAILRTHVSAKSSVLMVEENHKYFREKRGPVAMVSIDNYLGGWRVEPQFDFFFWATPRHRLAAVVSFLQMVRYSREVGACVIRVGDADVAFCEHLYRYDLLRHCGKVPNARADGSEYMYYVKGRKTNLQVVADNTRKAA